MLKKIFSVLIVSLITNQIIAQVLYSERFNTLSLTSGTFTSNNSTQTYLYSDVPTGMDTINNGHKIADTLTGNYPFFANGQKQKAWLAYRPAAITNTTDTFAVSTSWLKPTGNADAWLITPTIYTITAGTILNWEAMSPDLLNSDGYEVYVTTNTVTAVTTGDFSAGNRVFSTLTEGNTWQVHGVSLAAYAGQNIRIAFRNNSNNKYQLWLDDIIVQNVTNGLDAIALTNNVYKYSTPNINNYISATFKNNGYTPINSLAVSYKVGTSAAVTETITLSTPLSYLASKQLTFTTPFISSIPAYYPLQIWVKGVNGQTDQLHVNDTVTGSITLSNSIPSKKVLLEEFTSATSGWAPDTYTKLSSIVSSNTNVIVTALHQNDSLAISGSNPLYMMQGQPELPGLMIDRHLYSNNTNLIVNETNWATTIAQRQSMVVPVSVAVTNFSYNATTRQITTTVSATFVGDVKGQYNINLYIKENHVYGSPFSGSIDNQWNQHSYLFNSPSSPYYQLGTYLNSTTYLLSPNDYKHQNVLNEFVDGWQGDPAPIPTNSLTNGFTYSKAYSYTLPNIVGNEYRYNEANIYLIGVVSEQDVNGNGGISILNSAQEKLIQGSEIPIGVRELKESDFQLNIFPNPTSDICTLNYTIKESQNVKASVYNALGELVYIETLNTNAGNVSQVLNLNHLQQGNYSIVVSFKNNTISKKLTIIK